MQEDQLTSHRGFHACPSDSELAALLDGTLEEPRAEEVRGHVLDCADCNEVFIEAHLFEKEMAEKENAKQPGKVIPFPSRLIRRWLPIAAALLIATSSAYLVQRRLATPPPTPDQVAQIVFAQMETMGAAAAEEIQKSRPAIVRYFGAPDVPRPDQARIQIGVSAVDLRVGLRAGNNELVDDASAELLRAIPSLSGKDLAGIKDRLAKNRQALVDGGNGDPRLRKLARAELDRAAGDLLKTARGASEQGHQTLGLWTEGGRVAAKEGARGFFDEPASRAYLDALVKDQGKGTEAEIRLNERGRGELEKISGAWPSRTTEPDYTELAEAFDCLQQSALGQCGISE